MPGGYENTIPAWILKKGNKMNDNQTTIEQAVPTETPVVTVNEGDKKEKTPEVFRLQGEQEVGSPQEPTNVN